MNNRDNEQPDTDVLEDLQTLVLEDDMAIQSWEQQLDELQARNDDHLLAMRAQIEFMVLNVKTSRVQQLQALRSAREFQRLRTSPVYVAPARARPAMMEPIPFIVAGPVRLDHCFYCGAEYRCGEIELRF